MGPESRSRSLSAAGPPGDIGVDLFHAGSSKLRPAARVASGRESLDSEVQILGRGQFQMM